MQEMEFEKEEEAPSHINIFPSEIVGQVLGELTVVDRLQCEGVNRRWKAITWELGWTEQKKLSYGIVFEGATESQKEKFDTKSFIAVFRRVGSNLTELDLKGFPVCSIYSVQNDTNIFGWLDFLPNLEKLDISGINLPKAVYFLPRSLIELHSSGPFTEQNLTALTHKCSNLETIHFGNNFLVNNLSVSVVNTFFGRCQNLKTIHLTGNFIQMEENVSLNSLGQLEWLEELHLESVKAFDDAALTAVATGCPRLRSLKLVDIGVFRESIDELDQHPNLVDFELCDNPFITRYIEMEINGRWKLKKFKHFRSRMSSDFSVLREMMNEISSNLKESQSFLDKLIQLGFLPLLIKSLSSTDSELQFKALVTITAGTAEYSGVIVEAGAVPELLKLLVSEREGVREQSLSALANIICMEIDFRDHCIQLGIIDRLLQMVKTENNIKNLRNIFLLFENICQYPLLPMNMIKVILPVLGKFVQNNNDKEILARSIWGLFHIAEEGNEQLQLVIDLGVVPRLVSLLDHSDKIVQLAAFYTVGKISTGTAEQVQLVLDLGVLKMIPELFSHQEDCIAKECIHFLANIVCKEDRVQTVLDTGLVPAIIQILARCAPGCLRNEAVRAILNLAKYGRSEHVHYMLDYGVISSLCKLLGDTAYRNDLCQQILVGLKNILEKSGTRCEEVCKKIMRCPGFNKIRNLRNHENEIIKEIAGEIIENFFPPSEEQDEKWAFKKI